MAHDGEKLRILVVEDEEAIREGLCDVLVYHGYEPDTAESGDAGLEKSLAGGHALVVLDLMLPGIHGLEICRRLRAERAELPILMLTAKGAEDDVVRGFEAGADDYVTKPFSIRELVLRVEALLRRAGHAEKPGHFRFGPWEVDAKGLLAENVSGDDGHVAHLTRREVVLLELFAREAGRVLSRRRLLREAWDFDHPDAIETRTVDVHIGKLRRKIDLDGPSLIETVRGVGYRAVI